MSDDEAFMQLAEVMTDAQVELIREVLLTRNKQLIQSILTHVRSSKLPKG